MAVYSAEGVVLRKVDYGEADRILTIFTRERGKVPAIAKAVRRAKSRMSGQLDVFSHGRMLLAEGKRMDVVTQFQRITRSDGLAADLPSGAAAAVVVELADKVLEERHPQQELFEIVVGALEHLSDPATNARMELADFLVRVLAELGYAPTLGQCARCGKPLGESGLGFSPFAGGVICADCNRADLPSPPISARAVKVLRVCAAGDRDLFFRLRLDEADLVALEGALEAQLEHHLDRQLKSIDFARRSDVPPEPQPGQPEEHHVSIPAERSVADPDKLVETLVSLAKRRGFIFQSSEIYGGVAAIYDFGPLGVALRRNIRELWWRHTVDLRHDVVGLESSVIMHPRTWEASGHVESFTDPLVECKKCHSRYRADKLEGPCPNCGSTEFSEPRQFNLMFKTYLGPVEESAAQTYLRPETAQGMFVQFPNIVTSTRRRIPFGIAQVGKSFRNEITTEHFIFRLREFEQLELEFFVKPGTDLQWLDQWKDARMTWWTEVLGVRPGKIRARQLDDDELSHYSARGFEVEYEFPWGWGELEGIQDRTDYDLKRHAEFSGKDLSYFDEESKERYTPYVIEPSMGLERAMFTLMLEAYDEEEVRGEKRVVLRFHPNVALIQVAVLPLSKNEQLLPTSREIEELLRPHFRIEYDETQSIGRRYRRHDEIGTPFAVTVDFESLEDRAVTIRERDSMDQVRVPIAELVPALSEKLQAAGRR